MMLRSPYPYFGGKSRVAAQIWAALGDVPNYVEPFLGSAAVLLARPAKHKRHTETVNDKDGMISNFWRAVQAEPDVVARWVDWPVNENDLHARHAWLVGKRDGLTARLEGDPDYYDAKVAGWWVWGMAAWIGHGFCSGKGTWQVVDGELRRIQLPDTETLADEKEIKRQRVHVGNGGRGVNRQLVHVGDGGGFQGVKMRSISNRLYDYFGELQARLERVRVASGDWMRVMGRSVTTNHGLTGIVFDPPYVMDNREAVYRHDSHTIADEVRRWAIENGDNPLLRIVYCGYEDGYQWPDSWRAVEWKAIGGFRSANKGNRELERLWLSPGCLGVQRQMGLFEEVGA